MAARARSNRQAAARVESALFPLWRRGAEEGLMPQLFTIGYEGATVQRVVQVLREAGVVLLVDARHPGLDSDLEAWGWLGSQPGPRR